MPEGWTSKSIALHPLHYDNPVHCLHCSWRGANPPIDLVLHHTFTREQDPKICEPLHVGQRLTSSPRRTIHHFPAEYHGLAWRCWTGELPCRRTPISQVPSSELIMMIAYLTVQLVGCLIQLKQQKQARSKVIKELQGCDTLSRPTKASRG